MDSFRIVVTNPDSKKIRFVSYHKSWLHRFANPILKDSNRGFVSWPELPKIRAVFTNPTNPHESWRILSTIARNEPYESTLADSRIRTLRIRFVDSFCRHVFERFVSWIRFVDSFLKDSFRGFVSWKFFFQITRFVSFRKDSYTNPASLDFSLRLH